MRKLLAFISVALALLLGSAHAAPPLAVPPNVSPDPSLPKRARPPRMKQN